MSYALKPFYLNLNDLLYLLEQVNFVPLFDGPANSNGIVNFNSLTMNAWDAKGNLIWDFVTQTGSYQGLALNAGNVSLLGNGFPQVSSPIGIRDVTGLHNNLFGDQAFWGTVDVPFRRDIPADFTNYVTSPGANYTPGQGTGLSLSNVVDYMPRIISNLVTTAGVNLLKDASGAYVEWNAALYASDTAYAALIDASGVNTSQLLEGAKIVAPINTQVAILDNNGAPLVYTAANYQASALYTSTYFLYASISFGGLKDSTGGSLQEGEAVYYRAAPGGALVPAAGMTYNPDALVYKQLIDANVDFSHPVADGTVVTNTVSESGYGLLETLGHIDFQNPNSGEFFIGSENPGVAPVNSWFAIFGQFFDHGLDLIGKGGNGKVTIALAPNDPLYRAPGTNGPTDPGVTKMTVTRATIAGHDANGDPNYVNHTSPFIDQSQTYGSSDQITTLLREWVSTDNGATYHAGIELFDGTTLVDQWERRWPDGSSQMVNDTLPTLSELRDHVLDTGRDALSWEDVANYRNRDAGGHVATGNSGHALILDMNPNFDGAHLDSTTAIGNTTVAALVDAAVATLNASLAGSGMTFGQNASGNIELVVTGGAGGAQLPDGTYNGAFALAPWVNFSDFSINLPAGAAHDAVGQILMATVGDHYVAGDGRVNENFGLTSIHHVFHEEHNYQVENLKSWIYKHDAANSAATHEQLHNWQTNTGTMDANGNYLTPDGSIAWDANKMFNATKLLVEMEYQHAAVDQYARTVTPRIQEFVGYDSAVDATVSLEYSQVAFRFGHSTIRETIDTVDPSGWMLGNVTRYALEKAFLAPQTFAEEGVAAITLGLSRQQMNEVDEFITPSLTQGLLDQPLDLAAINIARGRDLGIPTLNDFRAGISLARYVSWDDFGKNMIHPESLVNFIAAYSFGGAAGALDKARALAGLFDGSITQGSIEAQGYTLSEAISFMTNNASGNAALDAARIGFDKIDSWIGGLAEAHVPGGLLGETFDAVFVAQIQSLMDGDRFYYLYRLFGTNIHEEVNNGQFKDIVERNTGLSHLNGSIFAYADKYYEFTRAADGTLNGTGDDVTNHHYHGTLAANPTLGIFSDGGASTAGNGAIVSVVGSDYVRSPVTQNYIRDVRPELDPTQVHPVEGTPTSGADSHEVIVGTDNADFIHGRGGDDTLYGEGGDDFLFGDGGVDRVYGGDGNDMIDTGEGPDLADGGAGKDVIYGRGSGSEVGGFDQLVGGSGNDLLIGGEGIDKLSGGSGDDIIYGDGLTNPEMGNTDPFTHGGDGNDYIDGGASGDLLYGEEGDDVLVGGSSQDLIQGGVGDDIIRPGAQSQAIGGGPDEVIGDDGYANTGYDLIDFSDYAANAPGVSVDFSTQANPLTNTDGTVPFPAWVQIEGAIGSRNNDSFVGDSNGDVTASVSHGNNWLIGGSGDDTFTGAGGNDIIVGDSIRLDRLIGRYVDAANVDNQVTQIVGSTLWLEDAMRGDRVSQQGPGLADGYDSDVESSYSGTSNRAVGALGGGLIEAANALGGAQFDAHFTEMLKSRMFKDMVLGDGGANGSNDIAKFSGNRNDYNVQKIVVEGVVAYKITDLRAAGANDGSDLVVGIERFQFADVTLTGEAALLNAPPVITGGPTASYSVAENSTAVATIIATDPDSTNLVWSIAGGADAASFVVNAVTGALSFVGAPNFEAATDAGANNVYDVVVRVTDSFGVSDTQAVAVTVTNVDEAPTGSINIVNYQPRGGTRNNFPVTLTAANTLTADPDGATNRVGQWQVSVNNGATWGDDWAANALTLAVNVPGLYRYVETYTDPFGNKLIASQQTVIVGAAGTQTLAGTAGDDIALGLGGGDILLGSAGNDVLDGGGGNDTASYAAMTQSVAVNLGANATVTQLVPQETGAGTATGAEIGQDYLISIANVIGGSGNDSLTGDGSDNTLNGGAGIDTLSGAGGNDTLIGGLGNDIIDGGAGNQDRAVYSSTVALATFTLNGSNQLVVSTAADGSDTLTGIESLRFSNGTGGNADFNNIVLGTNAANNPLNGSNNSDLVLGFDGADTLNGQGGNDYLAGGQGTDTLTGGSGQDTLSGGTGNDIFVFATGDAGMNNNRDVITDWQVGDRINLQPWDALSNVNGNQDFAAGFVTGNFTALGQLHYYVSGNDTIIEGNYTGNNNADFQIVLKDYTGNLTHVSNGAGDYII